MNVLAELACAQVPTSTLTEVKSPREKFLRVRTLSNEHNLTAGVRDTDKLDNKDQPKKTRNPIKELFERKNELNDRKQQQEKSPVIIAEKESIMSKQKPKKIKHQREFPLVRTNQFGGMAERKKRRDDKKHETDRDKIKDVYEFEEEESQAECGISAVLSYRNKNEKNNDISVGDFMSKTITTKTLDNETIDDSLGKRLESPPESKFQEIESFVPKTKGALKSFHVEVKQQQSVIGPMDEYVERKQRSRRSTEQSTRYNKSKKRSKNSKKRSRNAWYENDSSDEFITAVKTEDIGVGISKSQRTCSKGKQNLFAELSTSSESDYDDNEVVYQPSIKSNERIRGTNEKISVETVDNCPDENESDCMEDWIGAVSTQIKSKNDLENKKSESEMSDPPLVIDERKECDMQHNSDEDETDNPSEPAFELDDLYREDSSVAASDTEENNCTNLQTDKILESGKNENEEPHDLIPLEEALDLLDNSPQHLRAITQTTVTSTDDIIPVQDKSSCETEQSKENLMSNKNETKRLMSVDYDDKEDLIDLPEKLTTNEKPKNKTSDNLPLHVFLSRKVQESKKRKEEQLKKLQEEEERALIECQSTRRQRKCAIGKQGLLAEISSSDEEYYVKDTIKRSVDKSDYDRSRRQKRESKEKRKERYMEKKHEQIIAKEQKAIEEEILRELEMKKENNGKEHNSKYSRDEDTDDWQPTDTTHNKKQKNSKNNKTGIEKFGSDTENKCKQDNKEAQTEIVKKKSDINFSPNPRKDSLTTPIKNSKKATKSTAKPMSVNKKSKPVHNDRARSISKDDEELRTTKSWNRVEEGIGVAIGRRKRASANQLYYWSSSSDDDEEFIQIPPAVEEEDDRQEQHGWIVGDSHKKMITMLAMEKQLKEKKRRTDDELEGGKSKHKKHRNSTS